MPLMIPGIGSIHWHAVPQLAWVPARGISFAIWPAPVNGDVCFSAAGFDDFGPNEDQWDEDFSRMNSALVDLLERVGGESHLLGNPGPLWPPTWGESLRRLITGEKPQDPTPAECLDAAAYDDRFPPCTVYFGDVPCAAVRTSDGHRLWQVWLDDALEPDGVMSELVAELAGDRAIFQTELAWRHLLPLAA
jgi:hypothetical protein